MDAPPLPLVLSLSKDAGEGSGDGARSGASGKPCHFRARIQSFQGFAAPIAADSRSNFQFSRCAPFPRAGPTGRKILGVQGPRGATISGRGFHLFKGLRRQFRANVAFCAARPRQSHEDGRGATRKNADRPFPRCHRPSPTRQDRPGTGSGSGAHGFDGRGQSGSSSNRTDIEHTFRFGKKNLRARDRGPAAYLPTTEKGATVSIRPTRLPKHVKWRNGDSARFHTPISAEPARPRGVEGRPRKARWRRNPP